MAAGHSATRTVAGVFLAFTLMAALLWGHEGRAEAAPGPDCPTIMPKADLAPGQTGTALTVVQGTDPEPIDVEILGVAPDYLLPGVDLVVVDLSGPVIDKVGGGWAGISGSPVYIDGKLAGALAWGLSFGPTSIMGMTTAQDMSKVLAYGASSAVSPVSGPQRNYPKRFKLTDGLRKKIARSAGVATTQVGTSMARLPMPLSFSGVSGPRMNIVRKTLEREKAPFIPHAGASASSAPSLSTDPMAAGMSFAAALSYGDITAAGTGTATYVCDGKALAFGHYFDFSGETVLGANHATTFAIVDDPVFGPYKFARLDGIVGTVDEDRFTAIRAQLGSGPATVPIDSTASVVGTPRTRDGSTHVVQQGHIPFLAFLHSLLNIDSVFDRIGRGSSSTSWTVMGTRADGAPWSFTRTNMFASTWDISYESVSEMANILYLLIGNRFEDVEVTGVDVDFDVDDVVQRYQIGKLEWSTDRGKTYRTKRRVPVAPGSQLRLRVTLTPFEAEPVTRDFAFKVPKNMGRRGFISISGAQGFYDEDLYCLFEPEDCGYSEGGPGPGSFDDLLELLEGLPQSNVLKVDLQAGPRGQVRLQRRAEMDAVVSGYRSLILLKK